MLSFRLFSFLFHLNFGISTKVCPWMWTSFFKGVAAEKRLKTTDLDHKKSNIIVLFLSLDLQQITLSQYVNEMSNCFIPLNLKYIRTPAPSFVQLQQTEFLHSETRLTRNLDIK